MDDVMAQLMVRMETSILRICCQVWLIGIVAWFAFAAGCQSNEEDKQHVKTVVITKDGPSCDLLDRKVDLFRIHNGADRHAIAAIEAVGDIRICMEFKPDHERQVKYYVDDKGYGLFESEVLVTIDLGPCSVREAIMAVVEKIKADHAEIVVGTHIVNILQSPSRLRVRVGDVAANDYPRSVLRDAGKQRKIAFLSSMGTSGLVGDKITVTLKNPTAQQVLNAVVVLESGSTWNVGQFAWLSGPRFVGKSTIHAVDINIGSVLPVSKRPLQIRRNDLTLEDVANGSKVVWK